MVWKSLARISALLDDDERQFVLGDIQERGANLRTLLDLLGLVALRQLQAWKSSNTWVLAALLLLPTYAVMNSARVLSETASYFPWPDLTVSRPYFLSIVFSSFLAMSGLAWATGFALTSLARGRTVALFLPVALLLGWSRSGALLAGIPMVLGLARGWSATPLRPQAAALLAILCVPFVFIVPNANHWIDRFYTVATFWPAYYAITTPTLRKALP